MMPSADDPLRRSGVEKVVFILALQPPFVAGVVLRSLQLIRHPEIEPYFDCHVLWLSVLAYGAYLACVGGLLAVGLRLRTRKQASRAYVHVAVQSWWRAIILGICLHGPVTSPLWLLVSSFGFTCLLLFDRRVAGAGLASGFALLYGTTLAERFGWIPYAPIFREPPLVSGRVTNEWLIGNMLWPTIITFLALGIFIYLIDRERRQADALARLTRRLEDDLREAAAYVRSILPASREEHSGISADACFVPSAQLGGDAFTWL